MNKMTYVVISKDNVIAKVYEHDMIAGRTIVLFTSVNTDDVLSVYKVNGNGLSEKVTEVYMLDFFRELIPLNYKLP